MRNFFKVQTIRVTIAFSILVGIPGTDKGHLYGALRDMSFAASNRQTLNLTETWNNGLGATLQNQIDRMDAEEEKAYQRNRVEQIEREKLIRVEQEKVQMANENLARGKDNLNSNNYNQAIYNFTASIKLNANNPESYFYRGIAFYKLNSFNQAISDFTQSLTQAPNVVGSYFFRGDCYFNIGNNSQAIDDYTNAIALEGNNAISYNNRGLAYQLSGKYNEAIADYTRAIAIDGNDPQFYINRGIVYYSLNKNKQAQADAKKACQLGDCSLRKQ